ncbi:hypothetical protein GOV12_01550 [Candidatus Pacearchaeota archaeon]|nr:hypothetical protein [Candidatus Pacearchaeota archaeon]
MIKWKEGNITVTGRLISIGKVETNHKSLDGEVSSGGAFVIEAPVRTSISIQNRGGASINDYFFYGIVLPDSIGNEVGLECSSDKVPLWDNDTRHQTLTDTTLGRVYRGHFSKEYRMID